MRTNKNFLQKVKSQLVGASLLLAVAFLFCAKVQAIENVSLGAVIGDPTGISMLMMTGKNEGFDGALSYSSGGRSGTQIHGDYLIIGKDAIVAGDTDLDVYYGIGARLITISSGKDSGKVAFGPRAPIGLIHRMQDPRVEFFGEIALILDVTPSTSADFDLGVGIRYRF